MTLVELNEFFSQYPEATLLKVEERFFLKSHIKSADYHAAKTGKKVTTFAKKDLDKLNKSQNQSNA